MNYTESYDRKTLVDLGILSVAGKSKLLPAGIGGTTRSLVTEVEHAPASPLWLVL